MSGHDPDRNAWADRSDLVPPSVPIVLSRRLRELAPLVVRVVEAGP